VIEVNITEPTSEGWKTWVRACKVERNKVVKAVKAGKAFKFKGDLYKGKQKRHKIDSSFFFNTEAPFFGKCVYCEGKIFQNQHGDVEHFRPKGAVEDLDNSPIQIGRGRTLRDHPGYYWLAYDWKNLIPSCSLCNQSSTKQSNGNRIGKHNRFPVEGKHATKPNGESNEKPLLINPTTGHPDDDPSKHLVVDKTGVMVSKSQRGETCIDIFGLNHRDLPETRKAVFDNAKNDAAALFRATTIDPNGNEKKKLERKLKDFIRGKSEHSAAGREGIKIACDIVGITSANLTAQL